MFDYVEIVIVLKDLVEWWVVEVFDDLRFFDVVIVIEMFVEGNFME